MGFLVEYCTPMSHGLGIDLAVLALTPTSYGVPNDLLYVSHDLVGPGLDGWTTLIAFAVALATFVVVASVTGHGPEEETAIRHADYREPEVVPQTTRTAPTAQDPADPVVTRPWGT